LAPILPAHFSSNKSFTAKLTTNNTGLKPKIKCFDAVGWVAGRASGLKKLSSGAAGVVICLERGADLHSR